MSRTRQLSKVIVRAFEEYAKGTHTLETMAEFLAELGLETRHRTPLAKASISRMLTNRAYLGLVKHKGEYHEGRFEPILSATLFEAVQNILLRRAKPRKSKQRHDFLFTGLLSCGECGSAITAQFSRGKCGGIYRYYRCTKKKGSCSQKYLQEKDLAAQLKARLKSVALCDEWTGKMLKQVEAWEKEQVHSSQSFVQNLKSKVSDTQEKLDKLVSAYIDGDIPKENYLAKKEQLLNQKVSLANDLEDFGRTGKNWLQPLRAWILDANKAEKLSRSESFGEIKAFVQKIGTNPLLLDKSVSVSFGEPWDFAASRLAGRAPAERRSREAMLPSGSKNSESILWWTRRESNPCLRVANLARLPLPPRAHVPGCCTKQNSTNFEGSFIATQRKAKWPHQDERSVSDKNDVVKRIVWITSDPLDVHELRFLPLPYRDRDHVCPPRSVPVCQQPCLRRASNMLPLAPRDGLLGVAHGVVLSRLHLHKHRLVSILRHNVDFASTHPFVATQNTVPQSFEVPRCHLFSRLSKLPAHFLCFG